MISLYESIQGIKKLTEEEKNKLLYLDKLYWDFQRHAHDDCNTQVVLNIDEEFDKFIKARKSGIKYFPYLKRPKEHLSASLIDEGEMLIEEFNKLDCFLSKYYIELISPMIRKIKFFKGMTGPEWYINYQKQTPSLEEYQLALDTLKKTPFVKVSDSVRNIDAETAQKEIQAHIDKRGYEWEARIVDNLLPRMSVSTDKYMRIKKTAKFSKDDIQGLKAHEVDGHIGRRYYGYKTGLYLFVLGLLWKNDLDEGLAVYNSLHKVDKVKPNVMANISLKTIIAYQLDKMDFCDLFDFCKSIRPELEDRKLFNSMVRFKREI